MALDTAGHGAHKSTPALVLGALGVVYGDIGTSPIYALREAVHAVAGKEGPPPADAIIGILSIIVWALTIIVSIKYAIFVIRADNRGEGGTLSMMALARRRAGRFGVGITFLGMLGASLFFGDALITPAMSVLSAVEGIEVVTPGLTQFIVPITVAILVTLFSVQRFGTAKVAIVFGPIMVIWFTVLGVLGASHIADSPVVLWALSPVEAIAFVADHPGVAFVVMGAAFLAVTGVEALYADLGHFGRKPIMIAWFGLAFPGLLLNYFGQGAFIIAHGGVVEQPFFEMTPEWATLPFVILACAATVIAGQATITGAFSLARQAIQLRLIPRLDVQHTSETQQGQIYMPQVNFIMLVGVLVLVASFGSSSDLGAAYGIAVTGVMVVTTLLLFVVAWRHWNRPWWLAALLVAPFLTLEVAFLTANSLKFIDGGWVPVAIALALVMIMWTWTRGSNILFQKTRRNEVPLDFLAAQLAKKPPQLVPGTAIFLTSDPDSAPTAMMHSLKHYKVLHEQNVILTVQTVDEPKVEPENRIRMEPLNPLFTRIIVKFGYMEDPNVPRALALCRKQGWKYDIMTTSFFLSRRSLKATERSAMPVWQTKLYTALARNASDATAYFHIPTGRVVEIGTQVVL
ncbi:MAG: potassium transporter Kup [Rhizobiaceae bacterium]